MATKYVSTTGNNGNSGDSVNNAWRTLAHAFSRLAKNDTLKIVGGTYSLANGEGGLTVNTDGVTITAYDTTPVIIDGRAEFYPWRGGDKPGSSSAIKSNPANTGQWTPIIRVAGNNVTLEKMTIKNSAGEGVRVTGANATLNRLYIEWTYSTGLNFWQCQGGTATLCHSHKCTRRDTANSMGGRYMDGVTFDRCTVSHGGGEGLSAVQSSNVTMSNCTVYNTAGANLYIDCVDGAVVEGCLVFSAQDTERAGNPYPGIHITAEAYGTQDAYTKDVTVKNCVVVGCSPNFMIQGNQQVNPNPLWGMDNLKIFHNTFVDAWSTRANVMIYNGRPESNAKNTPCWFVNNIIVQRDSLPAGKLGTSVTDFSKWTFDYNLWSKAPPSQYSGANDIVDTTDKGGLASGTSFSTPAKASDFDIDDYKIDTDSAAKNAATTAYNATLNVTDDFFGSDRPESNRDMGAHEFDGTASADSLVADISADPGLTIAAGASIEFSDDSTENGAAEVQRWSWQFPGGSADDITSATPTVTYASPGVYTVTYTVWDDDLGLSSIATATVTVQAAGTAGDSFVMGVVSFDAGDTTIAHGMDTVPAAAILQYTAADTDNTAHSGAAMSMGVYSAQTGGQAVAHTKELDGGASVSYQRSESGMVVYDTIADHEAVATGMDDTNLTLAWSGSGAEGKGTAIFFAGSGISSAVATLVEFAETASDAGTTQTVAGQYNLAIIPATVYYGFAGGMSYGFAAADSLTGVGTQMAYAASMTDRASRERSICATNNVAGSPLSNIYITPSFGSNSLTLTKSPSASRGVVPVLAMNVTGVEVDIGVGQLPSSDVATDYATSFEDVGGLLIAATANTVQGSVQSEVPSFSAFAYDGTTQRSQGIYDVSSTSSSIGKSYTDDALAVYDGTADAATTATASFGTSKFTLTPTGAAGTYFAYIAFSEETTGIAPQAAFSHSGEEGHLPVPILVGDTVSFYDLSQDGSGTIDEWDWDWGDGTANGTTQNPTHVFSTPGEFVVTLTVTDDDDETDSVSKTLAVSDNAPTISYTLSAESGEEGDEITVDWSASTWYGTTIDEDASSVFLWTADMSQIYSAVGTEVDITVLKAGTYNIGWLVGADNSATAAINYPGVEESYDDTYDNVLTIYPESALSLFSTPRTGRGAAYVGPVEFDFVLSSNRPDIVQAEVDWDWGDGDDDADAGTSVSHEYDAVEEQTSYTVTIDVTYPDSTTDQLVATNLVTLVPEFVPPIPLATLAALWNTYQAHLGDLSDATWTREAAPNTNVWKWEASYDWASNITPRLFENGTELTARASVALCQANPGSYYATNSSGDITIYVHPTDSDNPNLNEERYRWID